VSRRVSRRKTRGRRRASLEAADGIFSDLRAIRRSERTRDAIARLGRVEGSGELTPTERRVAELIVDGKTNREFADPLFLSIKTVEANVSRVLAKLGVASRREVASRLVGDVRLTVWPMSGRTTLR
jgi:DNA-binding NarL/FixJ family response regulator